MNKIGVNAKLYGFTLKETRSPEALLSETDYQVALNAIQRRGDILDLHYESTKSNGAKARLHVHGLVEFDRIPLLTSICPSNFSTKFEKIYDLEGWNKYCTKDRHIYNRIDNKEYMFDD